MTNYTFLNTNFRYKRTNILQSNEQTFSERNMSGAHFINYERKKSSAHVFLEERVMSAKFSNERVMSAKLSKERKKSAKDKFTFRQI